MVALNPWELPSPHSGWGNEGVPRRVPGKKWDAVERVPTIFGFGWAALSLCGCPWQIVWLWPIILSALLAALPVSAQPPALANWSIVIMNDTCPDYTWGNSEAQTRQNFAELVRSHLDEMNRTDSQSPENQDHYTMAATEEALAFIERYPERKAELARRIREGRILMSPFLCNTLWGWQSAEGAIRSLYPARRLEREWGVPLAIAHHIECPSLPWGMATILAGCGVRWVNVPFLDYDCTFGRLNNPPVFILEGPDGSQVRVILDAFASRKANYAQGAHLLAHPEAITREWLPRYERLGAAYPLRTIFASGTHSDTHAHSAGQSRGFTDKIIAYNAAPQPHPKLVNGTLARFCKTVDEVQAQTPFLPKLRGCFGHSWELWPVSLAKSAADARENERRFLQAEALIARASLKYPGLPAATRADRERAEWCWAMLADHAWNGSDDANRKENARLRREWNEELRRLTQKLSVQAWNALGLRSNAATCTVFNSLGTGLRCDVVRLPVSTDIHRAPIAAQERGFQVVQEGREHVLYFVSPPLAAYGLATVPLEPGTATNTSAGELRATPAELENGQYRLTMDPANGGVKSLLHKETGTELVAGKNGRTLCQTIFFDGREQVMTNAVSEVVAVGPVLARLCVTGAIGDIGITNFITLYRALDRIDFDLRIRKPASLKEQRLCQVFPLVREGARLRVETTAAVLRPELQPAGDFLPGADQRRLAVQGFAEVAPSQGPAVTLALLDVFTLRQDLEPLTFEALGNDQNYKEVTRDQGGVTEFRFRYALRAWRGGSPADAALWSRTVAFPLVAAPGSLPDEPDFRVAFDSSRALATCLKPADDPASAGCILRLWEVGEKSGPLSIRLGGFRRAVRTDLLERDLNELPLRHDAVELDLPARGFATLRLVP